MGNTQDEPFLIWFAGFFDGEGCIHARSENPHRDTFVISVQQTVPNNGEAVIKEIQEKFGGQIYFRKLKKGNRNDAWMWRLGRTQEVMRLLNRMLPYLRVKKQKAIEAIKTRERVGKKWTFWSKKEEEQLLELLDKGITHREIAKIMGRGRGGVSGRARVLRPRRKGLKRKHRESISMTHKKLGTRPQQYKGVIKEFSNQQEK